MDLHCPEGLRHWSQTQFLEGHSSAQFSSNPNQTHLVQLIKVFRTTRNFQAGVIWKRLELNSAELWPFSRGLHGLKTEARTRPVPEIVWPDPSGTVKFRARTRPEIPPPRPTTNNKKKKEKGCISRLHAKKRINQGSAISQTFTSYESLWTSGAAVAYILPSLWILYGQDDDDRANYGHFLSVKAR